MRSSRTSRSWTRRPGTWTGSRPSGDSTTRTENRRDEDGPSAFQIAKRLRIYISKGGRDEFKVAKEEIETDFEKLGQRLRLYAKELGADINPPSGSWEAALVDFLKSKTSEEPLRTASVKGVLMDARTIESSVVAAFIRDLHLKEPQNFEAILHVFMGALIEEFISTISEVGKSDSFKNLYAMYDTSVLLRLLGCSGVLLRVATDELTRTCKISGFTFAFFQATRQKRKAYCQLF
jgi:hypothetical protein